MCQSPQRQRIWNAFPLDRYVAGTFRHTAVVTRVHGKQRSCCSSRKNYSTNGIGRKKEHKRKTHLKLVSKCWEMRTQSNKLQSNNSKSWQPKNEKTLEWKGSLKDQYQEFLIILFPQKSNCLQP